MGLPSWLPESYNRFWFLYRKSCREFLFRIIKFDIIAGLVPGTAGKSLIKLLVTLTTCSSIRNDLPSFPALGLIRLR